MSMARALHLCPDLIIVKPRHGFYGEISEQVMKRVRNLSPLVEQVSIDEAFLDISDLAESPETTAFNLQDLIRKELGLPCSIGIASNKLVAKIANNIGKAANRGAAPPNAITIVPDGQEAEFLAPLPVEPLWGVGPKTAARLTEMGVVTIGDLAAQSDKYLALIFGKNGYDLARHARGIDDSPIFTWHEIKSISQETTFAQDIRDEKILHQTLFELSEQVGRRLRQEHLTGSVVKLKIRWPDFTTRTRQTTFETPVEQDKQIFQAALSLLTKVWTPGQAVRLIGVGVSGLGPPIRQLSLWEFNTDPTSAAGSDKEHHLQSAIDDIRRRFGKNLIRRGKNP